MKCSDRKRHLPSITSIKLSTCQVLCILCDIYSDTNTHASEPRCFKCLTAHWARLKLVSPMVIQRAKQATSSTSVKGNMCVRVCVCVYMRAQRKEQQQESEKQQCADKK
ncbi:hypothetical protein AMECASPLE_023141 [Ameca splendens]|uniref:Secreted protein n=1 Tax=Ameca splendens TaxID=208324 RepID=A0ABV0XH11_9TELE